MFEEKKPNLAPKETTKPLNGASIKPGSPSKPETTPVGVVKKSFESNKHADKRLNKMFKQTNQPTLGVWGHDKKNDLMAKPDKVKFNPALDKTKEINQKMATMPKGKPNKDFDPVREKMIGQGFSPATKPAEKYKWSEGLSDDDNARVNKSLNSLVAYAGDKDLSKVNKEWGSDLYYQLKNEGASEEDALRLSEHFGKTAPSYEEANPDYKPAKRKFNVTLDGDHLGEIEAKDEYEAERLAQQQWPGHPDDDLLSVEEKKQESGPAYDVPLGFTGNTDDIEGMQSIVDNELERFGRIGGAMYDELDANGYYLDANNKVQRKVNPAPAIEPQPQKQQSQVDTTQTRKILKSMGYKDDDIDMILNSFPETHMKF